MAVARQEATESKRACIINSGRRSITNLPSLQIEIYTGRFCAEYVVRSKELKQTIWTSVMIVE
jgi:hypothetical protein